MKRIVPSWYRGAWVPGALLSLSIACSGGAGEPMPSPGFGVLSGETVLVLPVQYVARTPNGWIGGASGARQAARQTDLEIAFALREQGGRATWITPDQQVEALRRRPSIDVNPHMLSADEARREGADLRNVRDPLYGEIRKLAALFDARYALWPLEVVVEAGEGGARQLAFRTFLLDTRAGTVLWYGVIRGPEGLPATPGAVAAAAQAFAIQASP